MDSLRAQAAQASNRFAGGQPRLSTSARNAASSPFDDGNQPSWSAHASAARRADARTDHALERFADAAGEKKPSSAAPGDAFAGVAFFSSGGEKRGAPSSERRRLTRAATPSSVVRLRRLRDVVPSPTLVRLREAAPVASVAVGLPRLLRLPPRLRRRGGGPHHGVGSVRALALARGSHFGCRVGGVAADGAPLRWLWGSLHRV